MYSSENIDKVIVTGAAGFIGAALVKALLALDLKVIGIDNINDYYSTSLKRARLSEIEKASKTKGEWIFYEIPIEDDKRLSHIINKYSPKVLVHLAAQAGVRYSITNPSAYIQSNLVGFANVLEGCRQNNISHLIYASSSSVYGGNKNLPFYEEQSVNHPVSLYAATKKSNELMAHTYSHLYDLPTTGLRFFTVYGPWGRPDMAPMIFAKSILNNEPIKVFNQGEMQRDFTYIDDIVEGIIRCCFKKASIDFDFNPLIPNPSTSSAPYRIFNIGNSTPIQLTYFIDLLEQSLGKKAKKDFQPMQPGDVVATAAKMELLNSWVDYKPKTSIEKGISLFSEWYLDYFKKNT
ncbi:NAD-dependent epimerase/dehydratase family protein [Prochlorococcus marinus]|uniref:Protein CapI n=1 Tax=Prochlorococcus marinus XMU1408 TaxID=2213228 RepID=A0A318R3K8_PROMR|nr:NAD-dependent epimerase/dehydratase family protein [Prochlorococcus marinus]MBW3041373.1 protein CapI [Prochlorococcus marinus str. XMU1408]PYE02538.1 protein CapI [Prochlorococcus marinus XMU1408]